MQLQPGHWHQDMPLRLVRNSAVGRVIRPPLAQMPAQMDAQMLRKCVYACVRRNPV